MTPSILSPGTVSPPSIKNRKPAQRRKMILSDQIQNSTSTLVYCLPCNPLSQKKKTKKNSSLSSLISKISNVASVLCVLDCTILPLITFLLPLVGVVNTPLSMDSHHSDHDHHSHHDTLHELGHDVALFFVLPVGVFTMSMNFMSHSQKKRDHYLLSFAAILGLTLIYTANGGEDGLFLTALPHEISHALHCNNFIHKLVNVSGCCLLFMSNFFWGRVDNFTGDNVGRCCIMPFCYGGKGFNIRVTVPWPASQM